MRADPSFLSLICVGLKPNWDRRIVGVINISEWYLWLYQGWHWSSWHFIITVIFLFKMPHNYSTPLSIQEYVNMVPKESSARKGSSLIKHYFHKPREVSLQCYQYKVWKWRSHAGYIIYSILHNWKSLDPALCQLFYSPSIIVKTLCYLPELPDNPND